MTSTVLHRLAELLNKSAAGNSHAAAPISAFLAAKNGGLGLNVAQDKSTQEALGPALEAGVLLEQKVIDLLDRPISSEWLLGLLAPNPTRDVLVWMPVGVAQEPHT